MRKIYVSIKEDGMVDGWGSTRGASSDIELELDENEPFLSENPFIYTYNDGKLIKSDTLILQKRQEEKVLELNKKCNETILGRFSAEVNGIIYSFSHDWDAQNNFKDAKLSFTDGTIDQQMDGAIPWTAYDLDGNVVRLLLTKELFEPVYIARLHHIQGNISKFRDYLQPIVENAEIEELDSIVW